MNSASSKKLTLFVGRHKNLASGLWIYNLNLIKGLLSLTVKNRSPSDVELEIVLAGPKEISLDLGNRGTVSVRHLADFLGARRLGFLSDLFWRKPAKLLHGTSNFVPLFGNGKKILTLHDHFQAYPPSTSKTIYQTLRSLWYRLQITLMIKRADVVVTVSEFAREEILKRFKPKEIQVIYSPLDEAYLNDGLFKSDTAEGHKHLGFLAFASNDGRKNTERVILAFKRFLEANDEQLIIVSPNKEVMQNIKALVLKHDMVSKVELLSNISQQKLIELYSRVRGLVFPSIAEGFGYPIYEALSQGTAVLCSVGMLIRKLGQLKDLPVVFCDPFSIESIYRGILSLIDLEPSVEGRKHTASTVRTILHPETIARQFMRLYGGVLGEPFFEEEGIFPEKQHLRAIGEAYDHINF